MRLTRASPARATSSVTWPTSRRSVPFIGAVSALRLVRVFFVVFVVARRTVRVAPGLAERAFARPVGFFVEGRDFRARDCAGRRLAIVSTPALILLKEPRC